MDALATMALAMEPIQDSLQNNNNNNPNNNNSVNNTPRKPKITILSVQEKYNIVQQLEEGKTQGELMSELGLTRSLVSRIWQNRASIVKDFQDGKGVIRKLKKSSAEEVDIALLKWIKRLTEKNVNMSTIKCMTQATAFARELGLDTWKCSNGWFARFKRRHQISFGKPPRDAAERDFDEKRDKYESTGGSRQIEFEEADLVLAEVLEGREDSARKSFSTSDVAASGFEKFLQVNFKEDPENYERSNEGDLSNDYRFPDGLLHPDSEDDDDEDEMSGQEDSMDQTAAASAVGYDDETNTSRRSVKRPRVTRNSSNNKNHMPINEDRSTKLSEKKLRLEVDLLELERYKRKLEILRLERDLGLPYSKITSKLAHSSMALNNNSHGSM